MRRTLCALLLLLALPCLASAELAIQITSPADSAVTNSTTVTGTVTGFGDGLTVDVNGTLATLDLGAGTFEAQNVAIAEGAGSVVTATATDASASASTFVTITFDSVPPVISGLIPDPNSSITIGNTGIEVSGHVEDTGTGIDVFALRGLVTPLDENGNFDQFVKVAPGTSTVFVFARDKAGNTALQQFDVTRTAVCGDPPAVDADFPAPDNNDPNKPHTFIVDRNDDLPDRNPGDGACDIRDPGAPDAFDPPLAHCTLRAAVQEANAHRLPDGSGIPDRIFIGVRTIVLRHQGAREAEGARGDLDVTDDLRINGFLRDLTVIDARKLGDRVFDVAEGVKLQLLDLTVSGGKTPRPSDGDDPAEATGGCVRSRGVLRVNNAAFLGCSANGDGGAIAQVGHAANLTCAIVARTKAKASGGAIASDGANLEVRNSTLSFDTAGARGGAISQRNGSLALTNTTLSNDRARLAGGALDLDLGEGSPATVNNCTFSGNGAKVGSTLSGAAVGEAKISNSILADASRSACDPNALPESGGGNVERDESCLVSPHATDQTGVDPRLGSLANNGSAPPGFRPLSDSPAIDWAGRETACEPLDSAAANERSDWPGSVNEGIGADATPPFCDAGAIELHFTPPAP